MIKPTIDFLEISVSGDINKFRKEVASLTISTIIQRPTIRTLIHSGLKKSIILKIIDMHLTRFQMLINVSYPMNEMQVEDFTFSFIEEYSTESVEDFILFLNYLQKGWFGVLYNRIDKTVIFEYFNKYLEMKSHEREAYAQSLKNDSNTPIMPMDPKEKKEFYEKGVAFLERQKQREKESRFDHMRVKYKNDKYNVKITPKPDQGTPSKQQKQKGKKGNP